MITIRSTDGYRVEVLNKDGTPIHGITKIQINPITADEIISVDLTISLARLELTAHTDYDQDFIDRVQALLKEAAEREAARQLDRSGASYSRLTSVLVNNLSTVNNLDAAGRPSWASGHQSVISDTSADGNNCQHTDKL